MEDATQHADARFIEVDLEVWSDTDQEIYNYFMTRLQNETMSPNFELYADAGYGLIRGVFTRIREGFDIRSDYQIDKLLGPIRKQGVLAKLERKNIPYAWWELRIITNLPAVSQEEGDLTSREDLFSRIEDFERRRVEEKEELASEVFDLLNATWEHVITDMRDHQKQLEDAYNRGKAVLNCQQHATMDALFWYLSLVENIRTIGNLYSNFRGIR